MRGDEPVKPIYALPVDVEFPACAGMNRGQHHRGDIPVRVPRMRGDEPLKFRPGAVRPASSPHARG